METSIVLAWAIGEGILSFRIIKKDHRPPLPGELLAFSGLFAVLAIVSEFQPGLAALTAWGVDIAAFMGLFNGSTSNPAGASATAAQGAGTAIGNVATK